MSTRTDVGMVLWSFGFIESKLDEEDLVKYLRTLGIHGSELDLIKVTLKKMRAQMNHHLHLRVAGDGVEF